MSLKTEKQFFLLEAIFTLFGILSNLVALLVLIHSKRMKRIGTRNIYIFLFTSDSFLLFLMFLDNCALNIIEFDAVIQSILSCKLIPFVTRLLATVSPMLLVYISAERYISLNVYMRVILRKQRSQRWYLFLIVVYNALFYSPCLLHFDYQINQNETNEIFECIIKANLNTIQSMDFVNRSVMPSMLMMIATLLLIKSIRNSRQRTRSYLIDKQQIRFHKRRDIQLAISSVVLNLVYVFFTLPLPVSLLFGDKTNSDFIILIAYNMFCLSYGLNFYIIFISNSLFRKELATVLTTFSLKISSKNNVVNV